MNWLAVSLGFLTIASWASTFLLVRAALIRPRIGALIDRAIIAAIISAFGTVSMLLVINTETGWAFFALDLATATFRLSVLGLLLVPVLWIVLYVTDRLR